MNARTRPDAGHRGTMLILVLCASLVAVRVAGFEEDFEAAALTGWEFSGTPQLVRGVLGGPDNQAVELDQKPGTSIKRTDLQVAPGPDGVITVRWKFKYRWEAGHANIYVHFSQEPHPAQSLVWLYVPASTGNLGVHNYDGAKYARLNSCRADAEYEFIDILHTKDNRHDLIIVATGERGPRIVARHENLPLATTTAVWDPDQPLRRVSVGTGADGEEFSYWVDDIRVTAGAPGADQLPPRLTPVSYRQPPERLVWIEGETCTDHNWVEGPAYHCWTFGYHGIHGGVLDLATWQPPPPDGYTATFEVPVPEDERYTIYYLGRSVYLASPFSWRIDANPTQRYPPADGTFRSGVVAATSNQKYAVIRLGDVDLQAGPHTLRVTVSEPCTDSLPYYAQQIDALLLSRARPEAVLQEGVPPPPRDAAAVALHRRQELWSAEDVAEDRQEIDGGENGVPLAVWAGDFLGGTGGATRPAAEQATPDGETPGGNGHGIELALDPATAGLRRVSVAGTGAAIAADSPPAPFLRTRRRSGRWETTVGKPDWTRNEDGQECRLRGPGFDAVLHFSRRARPAEAIIRLRLRNTGTDPIDAVEWNLLRNVAVGGDFQDDVWIAGSHRLPATELGAWKSMISPTFKFDWVCVHDRDAAFYAYFEDRAGLDTRILYRGHGPGTEGGAIRFQKYPRIEPETEWEAPLLVLGAYGQGDWRPAADRFRQWWESWARHPHIPDWFKAIGGMTYGCRVRGWGWSAHDTVESAVKFNLERHTECRAATGIETFHSGDWLPHKTEGWYPENYILSHNELLYMRNVIRGSKRDGARYSIYTNPLMFSRVVPQFDTVGRRLAARAADGTPYFTEHTHRHHPTALPFPGEEYARHFTEWLTPVVLLTGVDILYLDQLGAVPSHLDYSTTTGHRHYGEWVCASARFCEIVAESLQQRRPDLAFGIEGASPLQQQFATFALLVYGDNPSQILRYVFPRQIHFVGSINPDQDAYQREAVTRALLTGLPLYYHSGGTPETVSLIRDVLSLKKRADPGLYQCRYRDTLGFNRLEGVQASVFVHEDGSLRIPFLRSETGAEQEKAVVSLDTTALTSLRLRQAECRTCENPAAVVPIVLDTGAGTTLTFTLPETRAGIVSLRP